MLVSYLPRASPDSLGGSTSDSESRRAIRRWGIIIWLIPSIFYLISQNISTVFCNSPPFFKGGDKGVDLYKNGKILPMQTFKALSQQLKLTPEQESAIESYCAQMVVELLESIKQDNVQNFDETISSINPKSSG
jgi:hypothetical protein